MKHLLIILSILLFSSTFISCSKSSDDGSKSTDNTLYVSVGESGTILTSPDGTTWTERTSGTSDYLIGVTYGNGLFVIVGYSGTILTSSDGTTWTERTSGTSQYTVNLYRVTYGNNTFVTVGYSGTILTSTDGTSWTSRTSGTPNTLVGVTYSQ
jgi:hypothetical protein